MFNNIKSILLINILALKVLSIPVESTSTDFSLPEKTGGRILCYLPDLYTEKKRECWDLNGYYHEESIHMKESGECEEFATCFLPYSSEEKKNKGDSQCVKFTYGKNNDNIYCSILYSEVPVPESYSFMEKIKILDTFYDHFHYKSVSMDEIEKTTNTLVPEEEPVTVSEKETATLYKNSAVTTIKDKDDSQCVGQWFQCGGEGFKGPTCCKSGLTCRKMNKYFSYCQ
jgi:hypothetical protein